MGDLLLVLTMLAVCGGLGVPVAYLLPERFAWRVLVAPTLGVAIVAVLAPVTYRFGLSVPLFFYSISAIGLASLGIHAPRLVRDVRRASRRELLIVLASYLACTLLLLAPRWIGGEQLAVFQGNPWDTFGYLESALSYARKSFHALENVSQQQLSRFQLFAVARQQLQERPSIHLLYATFSRVLPGESYHLYYAFLVFFLSQFFLAAAFVVRSILPSAKFGWCLAIAAAFPLGFWGQYAFDINAWSQVGSAPLLFLIFGLGVDAAVREPDWRTTGVLAVLVAGAIYIYPEGFIIYAAALFPVVAAFLALRMIRARRFQPRLLIPFASAVGIATAFLYPPLLHFLIKQVTWSKGVIVPWWQFFQAFFEGRDGVWGSGASRAADFAGSGFGFYFFTPSADTGALLALVLRVAIVACLVAVVLALAASLARRTSPDLDDDTRNRLRAWTCATLLMFVPAVMLYRANNYWPAGKVWSYAAPVFITLLCVPAAIRFTGVWRPLRWAAIAFLALQIAGAGLRLRGAAAEDGIFYAPPYPATSTLAVKREIGWDRTGLDAYLTTRTRVLVQPTHMWLEHGLMHYLFARRIPFALASVPNTYFGDGQSLPALPPPWRPDVEVSVDGRAFVLHFTFRTTARRPGLGDHAVTSAALTFLMLFVWWVQGIGFVQWLAPGLRTQAVVGWVAATWLGLLISLVVLVNL